MKKLKSNILIFSIFFVIAVALWFMLAFNETYSTKFNIPLRITELPGTYGYTEKTPQKIDIRILGTGKELYRFNKHIKKEFSISYRQLTKEKNRHYILRKDLVEIVKVNLPQNLKLTKIYTDTLFLYLKKIISKKVPVRHNLTINYNEMYEQFGAIETKPDSVIISGSESILRKIQFVSTQKLSVKKISDTVKITIPIETQTNVRYSTTKVSIMIPVERYTEKSIKLDISIENLPDTVKFVSFPKKAEVSFILGLSNYNKVSDADFRVYADYNKIIKNKSMQYSPAVEYSPNYIKNIRISPGSFEYFLEYNK